MTFLLQMVANATICSFPVKKMDGINSSAQKLQGTVQQIFSSYLESNQTKLSSKGLFFTIWKSVECIHKFNRKTKWIVIFTSSGVSSIQTYSTGLQIQFFLTAVFPFHISSSDIYCKYYSAKLTIILVGCSPRV